MKSSTFDGGKDRRKGNNIMSKRHMSWSKMEENRLALWCEEQKEAYANGTLKEYQIKLLEQLPGWTWDIGSNNSEEG
jgi:hypothetical protein